MSITNYYNIAMKTIRSCSIMEKHLFWFMILQYLIKVIVYPKYSKHWLSTVAHTIDCVCSKILNNGLNHGLLFSIFKFFGWKNILNQLENSGLKSRFLSLFSISVLTSDACYFVVDLLMGP